MLQFSRWKTVLIWLVVALGFVFVAPNFLSEERAAALPDWVPSKQVTLGLDLQGGSSLLLAVERDEVIVERLKSIQSGVRTLLGRAEGGRIGYTGLSTTGQGVQFRLRDVGDRERATEILEEEFAGPIETNAISGTRIEEVNVRIADDGLVNLDLTDEGIAYRVTSGARQAIEVLRNRIDELGTTEPIIVLQGDDRILVQVPGLDDPQRLKAIIGETAKLTFQLVRSSNVDEGTRRRPPSGTVVLPDADPAAAGQFYLLEDDAPVTGENLTDAQQAYDQRSNQPVVTFRFDTRGAQRFGQLTQMNVGRQFAVVLDDAVISAPVIRTPILGGSGQIEGGFTTESANDLALLLRAGALPVELTIIEERTVGPGLGADSIAAGQIAAVIGGILVLVFMLVAYGTLGILANIALVANIVLVMSILTVIGATLTLPGIAGIVLTIGMAVDSNVLIFERIREERRGGRNIIQSIESGFQKALTTILDANITTLIAAVILFYLGSGPVRGFAVTLAIGVATTVFTAFTLTRWLVAYWYRRQRPKELPKGYLPLPEEPGIKFMKDRKFSFPASLTAAVLSLALFASMGMNLGIDFRGGSLIEVRAKGEVADVGDIRDRLGALDLGDVQVQEFGTPRDVLIRVEAQGEEEAEQAVISNVLQTLSEDYDSRRVEVVGPTISEELAFAGTIAVLAALVAILAYIWVRFEWQFALGAIIATVHDVVLTIGMFVITGIEFNLSSIAAVLTIVGYSLNDTVVVYDRVRENLRRYKRKPLIELLDLSINQMLSRTILTSVTTLLALGSLWLFGGEVIRSFTFAMIFGVVIGTYSSIFIAAPVLMLFKLRPDVFHKKDEDEGIARFAGDPASP